MNLKHIIIGMLSGAMLVSSCSKELELSDPQGLPPETALATSANIIKVLEGTYDAISVGSLYGGNVQLYADLMGSNTELNWVGTFNDYREVWGKNMITTNPLVRDTWNSGYGAINIANSILGNIEKVDEDERDRVRGEALFIRCLIHFDLVRLYGKDFTDGSAANNPGVPIMTTPVYTTADVTRPSRNTVAEVYTAVINDLVEAENLLPESNGVFANKAAAAAILSRVYLQQADYTSARDAANRGIQHADGVFSLTNSVYGNYNLTSGNSPETILGLQVNDQDGTNSLQLYYSIDIFGARDGDIEINESFVNLFGPTDERATVTEDPEDPSFTTGLYTAYGAYRTTKWRDLYANVPLIRLAELHLTRAEANFRLGSAVGATPLADINAIRARANATPIVLLTLDEIYNERHRELAFEGFAVHDAKRFKRTIDGLPSNDNSLVMPIPFRELNTNSNLVQNPGYL